MFLGNFFLQRILAFLQTNELFLQNEAVFLQKDKAFLQKNGLFLQNETKWTTSHLEVVLELNRSHPVLTFTKHHVFGHINL
jgi:hypothetical protein